MKICSSSHPCSYLKGRYMHSSQWDSRAVNPAICMKASRSDLDRDHVLDLHAFPDEENRASSMTRLFCLAVQKKRQIARYGVTRAEQKDVVEIKIKITNLQLCMSGSNGLLICSALRVKLGRTNKESQVSFKSERHTGGSKMLLCF